MLRVIWKVDSLKILVSDVTPSDGLRLHGDHVEQLLLLCTYICITKDKYYMGGLLTYII